MRRAWAKVGVLALFSLGCAAQPTDKATRLGEIRTGIPGAEDIVVDARNAWAYISCDARRLGPDGDNGAIYGLPLPDGDLSNLTADIDFSFHPHGMGWIAVGDAGRLFVVNHRATAQQGIEHTIEIFEAPSPGTLVHANTLRHPLLTDPNDVAATSPRELFITNISDGRFALFSGGDSNLVRCPDIEQSQMFVVDDDLCAANGVHWANRHSRLYVTESRRGVIRSYAKHADGSVERVEELEIGGAPDNMSPGQDGIWVATHASGLAFMLNAWFGWGSDSRIDRIRLLPGGAFGPVERILTLDEEVHDAASVAAPWGDHLFVGSVYGLAAHYRW